MQRERRSNAGNRMEKLLDEEEDCNDDFYKTNYGGFIETESDMEYEAEDEGEDIVDSDFSIDENDEPLSETETDETQLKGKRLVTKAYKEPIIVKKKEKMKPKQTTNRSKLTNFVENDSTGKYERKSIRKSTAAKSAETAYRMKVRDMEQRKRVKRNIVEEWMPTQEQLLEEAKLTEIENLKSLEKYQKMENEKKITRPTKRPFPGPTIRYKSTRMPIIKEAINAKQDENSMIKHCERTFIIILNDPHNLVFNKVFTYKNPIMPKKLKCSVTGMYAKYVYPITSVPYHSSTCLKIIHFAYYQYLEHHGDKNSTLVNNFLKWYLKNKKKLYNELITEY